MNSKEFVIENGGSFCSMICYNNLDGRLGMGPDYIRMYHRYQITNGCHEITKENFESRRMSYMS